jgi:pyruvate formate lyase activating enzyme
MNNLAPDNPRSLPLVGSPFQLRAGPAVNPHAADVDGQWGHLHSIFPGSTVDGPGVRLVCFLSGCHFRCKYCHNPDTWKVGSGQRVHIDQLMQTIASYQSFLRSAGGGVTISGGEPLVQAEFAKEIARRSRTLGLSVALDTNGLLGARLSDEDIELFDWVLLDIKESDPARHLALTQQPLEPVLELARRLEALQRPTWIRFVLVPGLTDGEATLAGMRSIIESLPSIQRVDVLPFHQMGQFKWHELGLNYELTHTAPATPEQVARARQRLGLEDKKEGSHA